MPYDFDLRSLPRVPCSTLPGQLPSPSLSSSSVSRPVSAHPTFPDRPSYQIPYLLPTMAQKRLMSELQTLQKEKWMHIDVDERNVMLWKIGLMVVNPDSVFHGGYLKAEMTFTRDYPIQPPTFRFLNKTICHPNIYTDGKLCISILHQPGEDEQSGEQACERWSPLQGVESVLRSVLLLLDDPEINSPANVDASVMYRDKRDEYVKRARETVEKSKKDIPQGVTFPTAADLEPVPQKPIDDDDFWKDSEDEGDFDMGGSDSDFEMDEYNDDEDDEDADADADDDKPVKP